MLGGLRERWRVATGGPRALGDGELFRERRLESLADGSWLDALTEGEPTRHPARPAGHWRHRRSRWWRRSRR